MKLNRIIAIIVLLVIAIVAFNFSQDNSELNRTAGIAPNPKSLYEGLEFVMPEVKLPQIPDYEVSILDFGGVGDGLTDNSGAFADAIADIAAKGGGSIIVPRGMWRTGPITMVSNLNLHVQRGALIVFDDDYDKYPLVETSFEGLDTYRCLSPINGKDLENVAITGDGVIDGSGGSWRAVKRSKMTEPQWKKLVKSGGVLSDDGDTWYPTQKSKNGDFTGNFNVPDFDKFEEYEEIKDFLRPVMVSLISCNKVLLDGPTFQNSPAWNLHPLMCENVTLRNLTIRNPWYSQNGDGLDLESCKNAVIFNCSFDVGDDAICFKSGKNEDGLKRNVPTENVIVTDNVVYHGHGGFVIGSEMSGGVKNVHISNCTFIGTDCGLRFKSTRGRGGVVEDIYISKVDMIDIPTEAIRFNLYYGGESPIPEAGQEEKEIVREVVEVSRTTPSFKNIYMRDITSIGGGAAAFFQGLPEMKLQNIKMENMKLEAKKGITMIDASGVSFSNVEIIQKSGPAMTIFNADQLTINDCQFSKPNGPVFKVYGEETKSINLKNTGLELNAFVLGDEVDKSQVSVN